MNLPTPRRRVKWGRAGKKLKKAWRGFQGPKRSNGASPYHVSKQRTADRLAGRRPSDLGVGLLLPPRLRVLLAIVWLVVIGYLARLVWS